MSVVTNIVVCVSPLDEESDALTAFADWLHQNRHGTLVEVGKHAGGRKVMEVSVFAIACNYLDQEAFDAMFSSLPWVCPAEVVCVVAPQEGAFRVLCPRPR